MKRILALVFSFLFVVLLCSCGANNTADLISDSSPSSTQTEQVAASENATAAVESNSNVEVSSDAGNFQAGENLSWPSASMGDIPKLSGVITAVMTSGENSSVAYKGITKDQANSYAAKLETLGYQGYHFNDNNDIAFSGQNSSGALVTFTFNSTNGEAAITYTPSQE